MMYLSGIGLNSLLRCKKEFSPVTIRDLTEFSHGVEFHHRTKHMEVTHDDHSALPELASPCIRIPRPHTAPGWLFPVGSVCVWRLSASLPGAGYPIALRHMARYGHMVTAWNQDGIGLFQPHDPQEWAMTLAEMFVQRWDKEEPLAVLAKRIDPRCRINVMLYTRYCRFVFSDYSAAVYAGEVLKIDKPRR